MPHELYGFTPTVTVPPGILPPASGGTGTATVFTQGSVVFAGAAGAYTEDNANLFYNNATKILLVTGGVNIGGDVWVARRAAATLNLGVADAVAPVAQTLSVQGARGGIDVDVAGVVTTLLGSLGTGAGAGGSYLLRVGKVQGAGSGQHVATTALQAQGNASGVFASVGAVGSAVNSGDTITPTANVFHVTGVTTINTINVPYTGFVGPLVIIPDGIFLTGLTGNIAIVSTSVVGKALIFHYDTGTAKWYPSY